MGNRFAGVPPGERILGELVHGDVDASVEIEAKEALGSPRKRGCRGGSGRGRAAAGGAGKQPACGS